jgi:Ca-activated chloride channel family protein
VTPASPLAFQVLGAPARLLEPGALWLLLPVAALAGLAAWRLLDRRALLRRTAGPQASRLAPRAGLARPAGRVSLWLTGLLLLAVALSRPQCGTRTELSRRYGLDLVVLLDVSRSMQARDVPPDRLARAVLEVGSLLDQLAGDRVGVVVFAGEAFVQCPLTTDYQAARLFLRSVGPGSVPQQGSDLGHGLRAARQVLEQGEGSRGRGKVVLVVSDGEDLEGDAGEAAGALGEAGIRVHALAVGTAAGQPIPLLDGRGQVTGYKRDRSGRPVVTRLDLSTLREVAARGGGEVFDLDTPDRGLPAFKAALDGLEKSELTSRVTVQFEDRYAMAAFPAFLLLVAGLLLGEAGPRRRPSDDADEVTR